MMENEILNDIENVDEIKPDVPENLQKIIEPKKRGRGRHPKDCNCETCQRKRSRFAEFDSEKSEETKDLIDTFEEMTGDLLEFINERMPNPKPVNQLEKKLIGKGVKRVAEKYSPQLEKFGAEAMLGIGLFLFAFPRLKKPGLNNVPGVAE